MGRSTAVARTRDCNEGKAYGLGVSLCLYISVVGTAVDHSVEVHRV
jgi:hypothetical protein